MRGNSAHERERVTNNTRERGEALLEVELRKQLGARYCLNRCLSITSLILISLCLLSPVISAFPRASLSFIFSLSLALALSLSLSLILAFLLFICFFFPGTLLQSLIMLTI